MVLHFWTYMYVIFVFLSPILEELICPSDLSYDISTIYLFSKNLSYYWSKTIVTVNFLEIRNFIIKKNVIKVNVGLQICCCLRYTLQRNIYLEIGFLSIYEYCSLQEIFLIICCYFKPKRRASDDHDDGPPIIKR